MRLLSATRLIPTLLVLGLGAVFHPAAAPAQQFYRMSTIAPGTTPYIIMTTLAQVVKKHAGIELQVNATGAATRHAVDAARGKIDFFMSAPVVTHFMSKQLAMYKKMKEAPALEKNLRGVFNFPIGVYHMVVYADSGIKHLKDIKGKKVFLGPPTGAAKVVAAGLVEGATGYKPDKEYTASKLGFAAAAQAFQDRQLDLYIQPTNYPSPAVSQVALANKITLLGVTDEDLQTPALKAIMKLPGRTIAEIPAGAYGKNQTNTASVKSIGSWVGVGTHKGVSADVVYRVTKAFFENLPEVHAQAVWMKVITLDIVFQEMNMPLHPGAIRYYEEKGLTIPAHLRP